jgi:mannose-6-phosphate isomerase-like protein (cupin superfamily)
MNTATQIDANRRPLIVKRGEGETIRALGSEFTFLSRKPGAWSLMLGNFPKNVGAPRHEHDFDECYYLVSGSIWLTVAGQETALAAGDFVHIPGGTVHGFKGTSDTTQILMLEAPGDAAEEFFRACSREITKIPADFARVPDVAARHGIRVARSSSSGPAR